MSNSKLSPSERIKIAENNLYRVNYWISNSDAKIGIVAGFQLGLTAFLTTKGQDVKQIITTQPFDLLHFVLYLSLVLFILFIIKSVYYAFKALYPDIKSRESSPFFFGAIASMGIAKFKKEMTLLTEESTEEEFNNQTYINSEIAVSKFNNLRSSISNLLVASLFWILVLVLIPFFL